MGRGKEILFFAGVVCQAHAYGKADSIGVDAVFVDVADSAWRRIASALLVCPHRVFG